MSTRDLIEVMSEESGVSWNLDSMLEIVCQYIDNQKDDSAFEEFIRMKIQEEKEESTEENDEENE